MLYTYFTVTEMKIENWNCSEFCPCTTIVWCLDCMCALCVHFCVSCTVSRYIHLLISNSSVLCLNRSSTSYTVKWAPPSSFVRFVLRTTRTSRSNPVVTWCALLALRPGRYCAELCCMKLISGSDLWMDRLCMRNWGYCRICTCLCLCVQYSVHLCRKTPGRSLVKSKNALHLCFFQ